jgi:hypothetical protein
MTTRTRRVLATLVALSLSYAGMVQAAAVGVSPASQLIGAEQVTQQAPGRALLEQTLQRADVVSALQARGVSVEAARARVAALTDEEAAHVAAQIDSAPAGADGVIGTLVFIFVLLLITDILGFTKIFPFTRPIR